MRRLIFILVIALLGDSTTLWAQAPALPAAASVVAAPGADLEPSAVRLLVGRSTVVDVGSPIVRVSLTSADIADALVTSPNQLLVNGKMPGTISMFVWDKAGAIRRYEVMVQRDLSRLSEQLKQLFPSESISVQANGKSVVLSGSVATKDTIDKAINLATGYVEKKEEVVSLLQLAAAAASNQVLLQVRFAEVSRNALTELGATLFTGSHGFKNYLGRSTTQQFPGGPGFATNNETSIDPTHLVFSDFLNLFLFDMKNQLGVLIKALQTKGLFQSLAEPNLVAESGKEASFLAGGEFPIPVAQGSAAAMAITVQFKEFGVRLNFTPQVEGERVHLKVRPEVSTLDFTNAVVLNGFRIPALTTRRTETEIELMDGQTFAIAGLLNNTMTKSLQKIPGIGDIPILGLLFKSQAAQKERTELVVIITPKILPRNSNGVTPDLPRLQEPYLPPLSQKEQLEPPAPAFKISGNQTPATPAAAVPPAPASQPPSAADAAKTVSDLTPGAPKVTQAPATAPRPEEKKALEHAQQQEREVAKEAAKLEQQLRTAQNKERAKQLEIDRRNAAKLQEQQAELAREQAKRDAEAAKKAAEAAKRQAEIDREHQKTVDEAAAKLKAAEAAYQAELAKRSKSQQ